MLVAGGGKESLLSFFPNHQLSEFINLEAHQK